MCYLQKTNSLNNLRYYFDRSKLINAGIADPDAYVKGIFQQLFQNKVNDIFKEVNQGGIGLVKCQQLFGTSNPNIFLNTMVNDLNNPVYNFDLFQIRKPSW